MKAGLRIMEAQKESGAADWGKVYDPVDANTDIPSPSVIERMTGKNVNVIHKPLLTMQTNRGVQQSPAHSPW